VSEEVSGKFRFPIEGDLRYPVDRDLVVLQSRSGRDGEEQSLSLPGIETPSSNP
jgi:hypothetical protein